MNGEEFKSSPGKMKVKIGPFCGHYFGIFCIFKTITSLPVIYLHCGHVIIFVMECYCNVMSSTLQLLLPGYSMTNRKLTNILNYIRACPHSSHP